MAEPNNLKLASVLRGRVPDALLDIYELERRPIAVLNVEKAVRRETTAHQSWWAALSWYDPCL